LLLLQQRLQALAKFGLKQRGQFLKQRFHRSDALSRLGEGLPLQLQLEVTLFHCKRP